MDILELSFKDIKWVKNVKREKGTDWAFYDQEDLGETMKLTLSKTQRSGAARLIPGEIVLLYQRVDKIEGVQGRVYLTHLVTPLFGSIVEEKDSNEKFKYYRNVHVIARANPKTAIPSSLAEFNFKTQAGGRIRKVEEIDPKYRDKEAVAINELKKRIWNKFKGHFLILEHNIGNISDNEIRREFDLDDAITHNGSIEGATIYRDYRNHLLRERDPKLIRDAKGFALAKGNGVITCECCGFNFNANYGIHGTGFIECHHKIPIAKGGVRRNRFEDLAMVCANCHRMLHRKNQDNDYYTVEQLREVIMGQLT